MKASGQRRRKGEPHVPKVVLLLESSRASGRALLCGVARYAHLHGPWSFYWEPAGLEKAWPMLKALDADGVILRDVGKVEGIVASGIPAVVVGHNRTEIPGLVNAVTDSTAIGRVAAEHLLDCGFRHFGYCGLAHSGIERTPWSQQRGVSFSERVRQAGFQTHLYAHQGRAQPSSLSQELKLNDVNCWLGLANWNDPPLNGSINEFRIYEGALNELEIILRRQAGPTTLPQDTGPLESLELVVPPVFAGNPNAIQAALIADYENIQDLDVSALLSAEFASSDESIFTVDAGGLLRPVNVGSAELRAAYGGLSVTSVVEVLTPTALTLAVPSPLAAGGPITRVILTATAPGGEAEVTDHEGVVYASSNPQVATIDAGGGVLPLRVGTTTLSASFRGVDTTTILEVALPAGSQQATLIHRYSFSEAAGSTVATDSVGDADGALVNPSAESTFTGTGRLRLQGGAWNGTPQSGHVNLPNGLVSTLPSVAIEGWIQWGGPADSVWQRIFDFGNNSAGAEDQYVNPGLSYMFLSPRAGNGLFRFTIREGTAPESPILDVPVLPAAGWTEVGGVVDNQVLIEPSADATFYRLREQ